MSYFVASIRGLKRFRHLTAVALVATVSLFVTLGLGAGSIPAAIGTSGASASEVVQGKVRIHLRGYMKGPQFAAFGRGRFTASGAITDRGRFVDEFEGIHPPNEPRSSILRGSKGTIWIDVDRWGQWRITGGTKAYSGLRGRGTQQGQYRFVGIEATLIGKVSQ